MDTRTLLGSVLLLLVVGYHPAANAERLKMCVVETVYTTRRIRELCPQLLMPGSQVECVIGNDRFDCLRQMTRGTVHLAILEPEDLVVASAYWEYQILVTTELRLFRDESNRFEMVALAHKDVKNAQQARGKRFCHPGFETRDGWTKAILTYFQNWMLVRQCDPDKTLLENQLDGLSRYFESGCIAGPWSSDTAFDSRLKAKYRNLCGSCGNPVGCYANDKYHGPEGALLCLTDNAGDIAWVRLEDAREHFKDEQINAADYVQLCPDGTARAIRNPSLCVWLAKPWPVIVARSEMAEKVNRLVSLLKGSGGSEWQSKAMQLMASFRVELVNLKTPETPEDYLRNFTGFLSAYERASCESLGRVSWCVSSNLEDRKCRWLRDASFVYGIEPGISCIQRPDRMSCLESVGKRQADLFVARPDELLSARKKGLVPIVQAIPKKKDLIRIAAVVRGNSRYKSLADLKGSTACIAGFRGIGWNTLVHLLRNISSNGAHRSDTGLVADFFESSCVLGLSENDDVPYNLRSRCVKAVNGMNDANAFECVSSGHADVAIVNLKNVENKIGTIGSSSSENNKDYRTLCLHETDSEDDQPCLLVTAGLSMVVVNENATSLRREEIYSMLLEMDKLFGQPMKGETPAFSLYGPYDTNHSVIFPEETHHLEWNEHQTGRVRNYVEIVEGIVKEAPYNSATRSTFYLDNLILFCVLLIATNEL